MYTPLYLPSLHPSSFTSMRLLAGVPCVLARLLRIPYSTPECNHYDKRSDISGDNCGFGGDMSISLDSLFILSYITMDKRTVLTHSGASLARNVCGPIILPL